MKIVLACEGQSEVFLIQSLLSKKQLSFSNEILADEPLRIRQLKDVGYFINMLPINEEIIVFRIGDTLKDELSLKGFELRKEYIKSYKICTKTEIEILIIINEGLYQDYLKDKRKIRPKEFVKEKVKNFNFKEYIESHNLTECIKAYNTLKAKKHKNDEYSLYDLISELSKRY